MTAIIKDKNKFNCIAMHMYKYALDVFLKEFLN